MFGISKCLKSLNMPQTIIKKNTDPPGPKKRYSQVVEMKTNQNGKRQRHEPKLM